MNFAKNLLGKYGWKEGDGLGRDKHGITKPLKANYKFDNAGLGHNPADDLNNHWWENVYNQAATNLNVGTNEANEVKVGLNTGQSVEITTKNYSVKSNRKNADYGGSFLKSATLTNEGQEVEVAHKWDVSPVIMKIVSDEELLKACGGRTAHKGARHGLKLAGKLKRIEEQEQELVNKLRSSTLEDSSQVFKDYADSKSRHNQKKLKRLNDKKRKKPKKSNKPEAVTPVNISPPVPCTTDTAEVMEGKQSNEECQEQDLVNKLRLSTLEDCAQVFKDCKSRHNKKKLKRLNENKKPKPLNEKEERKSKKSKKSETATSANILPPAPCTTDPAVDNEVIEEKRMKKSKNSNDEHQSSRDRNKSRKNKLSIEKPDKRSKRKNKKKLKALTRDMRVPESREEFLKKMAIEELPISFESVQKLKKNRRNSDPDDVSSLHSYRCNDEDSQSDNDNVVEQKISSLLSEKLSKIKKKKQKVIVEDLTEFQIDHLRNAQVPFVEVRQCTRRQARKNAKKLNKLADKLVSKMSIL